MLTAGAVGLIVTISSLSARGRWGVRRPHVAPRGGPSSPPPVRAAVPPGSRRMPPTPAAPPAAPAARRPAAPGLRGPGRPALGIRSRRSPWTAPGDVDPDPVHPLTRGPRATDQAQVV